MVTFSTRPLYPRLPVDGRLGGCSGEENFPFIFSQALYWQSYLPRLIIRKLLFTSSTCEIIEISRSGNVCKIIFAATPLANVEKYAILFHLSASPCLNRQGNLMPVLASKLVFHYSPLMHRPVVFN
jgi:hypothetical protein